MQVSDVLENTDVISEIANEFRFKKHLKKLSNLPDWKKKEIEQYIYDREFAEENFPYLL